jgi:ribosomal protein S18 acetylase RimI-like enzyme
VRTPIAVRPAAPSDASAIARVRIRSWRAAYAGIVPAAALAELDLAAESERWRLVLSTARPAWVRGAFDRTPPVLVGWLVAGPARGEDLLGLGEIYAIYVDPEDQGRGVGRALLETGLRGLQARGYAEAILWVFEANAAARGLYERMGWAADGATKPFAIGGAAPIEVRYRRRIG